MALLPHLSSQALDLVSTGVLCKEWRKIHVVPIYRAWAIFFIAVAMVVGGSIRTRQLYNPVYQPNKLLH